MLDTFISDTQVVKIEAILRGTTPLVGRASPMWRTLSYFHALARLYRRSVVVIFYSQRDDIIVCAVMFLVLRRLCMLLTREEKLSDCCLYIGRVIRNASVAFWTNEASVCALSQSLHFKTSH